MLRLFIAPGSCSLASHIALEQAGATYDAIFVDFSVNAQRESEYLKINPKGRVPALVTERGILTETPAILAFVADSYPGARLTPQGDAFALARVHSFNSYLCSTVHVAHAHRMRGYRWADDPAAIAEMKRKAPSVVTECFELIERELFQGPWVMGNDYGIADIYLFTVSQWLEADGVELSRLPRVLDHRRRVAALPAVEKVVAEVAAAKERAGRSRAL